MKIAKHSYAITGLGTTAPWAVNAGLIVGQERTLIIDTGANYLAAQTIHGYATALRSANDLLAFNCEPHFDHIGGNSYFQAREIPIYGHPAIQRTDMQFQAEKAEYNQSILNPVRAAAQEADAFFVQTELANPTHPALIGEHFDLGEFVVEVIALPGHTAINQGIYNPIDNTLFCADCIVTDYIPNLEAGNPDLWHQWLESLALIEQLAPTAVVPGHGMVMHGSEIAIQIVRMRTFLQSAISNNRAPTL